MEIRRATPADVESVQAVARATWHAAYDDVIGSDAVDAQVDEWYARDAVEDGIERERWPYLVADDDGVVGYAVGGPTDDGPADAVVAAIYVRPGRWGEGVGTALLSTLHDRLRGLGCDSAWLVVLAANDVGRSFYDGHGYEVHDRRTAEVGGQRADELVLVRAL